MMTALGVVLLVPTVLDVFVYVLPAFAGVITMFCVIEMGKSWAFGVYAATAIITMLLIPNKEAAVLYTAFFGYYPIVKALSESKLPKILGYLLKFAVFNVAVAVSYMLLVKVFGIPFNELMGIDTDSWWAKFAVPVMLVLGNIVFILFDFLLTRLVTVYLVVWQKKFHKMFRFK